MNARVNPALEGPGPVTKGALRPDGLLWLPAIGDDCEGGKFVGIGVGRNGAPNHLLIDLGEAPDTMTHEKAVAWAVKQGGELMNRDDARILWANARATFKTDYWYWLLEEYEGAAGYAWVQIFSYGYQDASPKRFHYRARAVRRLPIQ